MKLKPRLLYVQGIFVGYRTALKHMNRAPALVDTLQRAEAMLKAARKNGGVLEGFREVETSLLRCRSPLSRRALKMLRDLRDSA